MKKILYSDKAPEPIGPYSQATGFENLIFTSGQIPTDLKGNKISEDVSDQTKIVIENLRSILEDNNSSLDNVIKTTVFLKDMSYFEEMNIVYKEFFKNSLPSRSTIAVAGLPKDVKVEIEVVAYKNS